MSNISISISNNLKLGLVNAARKLIRALVSETLESETRPRSGDPEHRFFETFDVDSATIEVTAYRDMPDGVVKIRLKDSECDPVCDDRSEFIRLALEYNRVRRGAQSTRIEYVALTRNTVRVSLLGYDEGSAPLPWLEGDFFEGTWKEATHFVRTEVHIYLSGDEGILVDGVVQKMKTRGECPGGPVKEEPVEQEKRPVGDDVMEAFREVFIFNVIEWREGRPFRARIVPITDTVVHLSLLNKDEPHDTRMNNVIMYAGHIDYRDVRRFLDDWRMKLAGI